ncbi:hypothetical protein [Qipengyuania sp.]|uniref:hypothetical protein n=1 Tax=Qipengyuania sp. TaxID=2004515 RepID=UPI003BAA83D0
MRDVMGVRPAVRQHYQGQILWLASRRERQDAVHFKSIRGRIGEGRYRSDLLGFDCIAFVGDSFGLLLRKIDLEMRAAIAIAADADENVVKAWRPVGDLAIVSVEGAQHTGHSIVKVRIVKGDRAVAPIAAMTDNASGAAIGVDAIDRLVGEDFDRRGAAIDWNFVPFGLLGAFFLATEDDGRSVASDRLQAHACRRALTAGDAPVEAANGPVPVGLR